jgi:ABC-type nitrate/sulfonate/bicarbonate transport system substrate-binding protein
LRVLAAGTAMSAVAVGAAACSSGSSGSSGSSSGSSSSSTAVTTIKYGQAISNLTDAAMVIAQKDGYFTEHHINFSFVNVNGGTTVLAAITSGSVQVGGTTVPVMLLAAQQKTPLVATGLNQISLTYQLVLNKQVAAAKNITPTTSVSQMANDIKGMTIGNMATGATGTLFLDGMVNSVGHDATSWFKHNSVRVASEQLAALQHKLIDGTFTAVPVPQTAAIGGYGTIIFNANSVPAFQKMIYGVMVARPDWAKSHAAALKNFNAAVSEAQAFILDHPAQAAQEVHSLAPTLTLAQVETDLKELGYTRTTAFPAGSWAYAAKIANQYKLEKFNVTSSIYNSAYTNAYSG